ncbi:hypothetical protein BKD09_19610 [Bradyrhizobium japonicum]|uniref:Oligosaccharide repeat unit polymerase n=2 Tax=Bradyrhizobium japonicum TaxID=375 RepID=A0A1L3FB62_BRAJP|nr:hypothetical protein BKD09_19610 [Bradyrhizobium japonicum]
MWYQSDFMNFRKRRRVNLAVGVAVAAYITTSGAAALIPFPLGQEQLGQLFFPQEVPYAWMTTLGSATYWLLFLLTLVALPIAAIVTEKVFSSATLSFSDEIPLWIPLVLAGAMIAFCIWRLAQAGGLSASEAWDQSLCYEEKILRRVELFNLLSNKYYSFVYSSLPIVGCYLLARGLLKRENVSLGACAALSLIVLWLDVATIQKAPALLYVLVLGLTLALSGFGLVRTAILTVAAGGTIYLALALSQFCEIKNVGEPENTVQAGPLGRSPGIPLPGSDSSSALNPPSSVLRSPSAAVGEPSESAFSAVLQKAIWIVRSGVFRMAVGIPYYVQIFSDPDQRCGIVRPTFSGLLAPQPCYPATKVFAVIYPAITYTMGSQPAGVSLSGYAEGGLFYAVLATVIAGSLIGVISVLARGNDPMSIAMQVAGCLYAYYVTQVPLTATLLDSYGLVWLIAPLAAMRALAWMINIILRK